MEVARITEDANAAHVRLRAIEETLAATQRAHENELRLAREDAGKASTALADAIAAADAERLKMRADADSACKDAVSAEADRLQSDFERRFRMAEEAHKKELNSRDEY